MAPHRTLDGKSTLEHHFFHLKITRPIHLCSFIPEYGGGRRQLGIISFCLYVFAWDLELCIRKMELWPVVPFSLNLAAVVLRRCWECSPLLRPEKYYKQCPWSGCWWWPGHALILVEQNSSPQTGTACIYNIYSAFNQQCFVHHRTCLFSGR